MLRSLRFCDALPSFHAIFGASRTNHSCPLSAIMQARCLCIPLAPSICQLESASYCGFAGRLKLKRCFAQGQAARPTDWQKCLPRVKPPPRRRSPGRAGMCIETHSLLYSAIDSIVPLVAPCAFSVLVLALNEMIESNTNPMEEAPPKYEPSGAPTSNTASLDQNVLKSSSAKSSPSLPSLDFDSSLNHR